jgi:hypothetical protein
VRRVHLLGVGGEVPAPGSEEARRLGCTCPVVDNERGRGFQINGQTVYWQVEGCPLHEQDVEGSD